MQDDNHFKLYIFDADGTLRRSTVAGQPCPNDDGQWELLPNVKERLAAIDWNASRFGIATNQGGVGLGYFSHATARRLLVEMVKQAFGVERVPVGAIEICTHAPHLKCACRKPHPTMLLRLMQRFGASEDETLYVGDMDRDAEAARRAGVRFMWADEFFDFSRQP